mgnify:CR=1 FL=1
MRSPSLKRAIDIVGSSLGLLVASVPMAVLAVLIRRDLGKPVLFRQVRPGMGAEPFTLIKFRTMRSGAGTDAERLTPLGRFVRSLSLDEVPELWNVLRGDMSLVGPRPLLPSYVERYNARQARRHEVRPGLTGLAQVEGRNALSWEDRFELDVQYVDTWSVRLDLAIIARTVWLVLKREGIAADGHATMPEFQGENR